MEKETLQMQFASVTERVDEARRASPHKQTVRMVAVSKKQSTEKVQAYLDFCEGRGARAILGENYVQEWVGKRETLRGTFETHLIGPLQSNKIKTAVHIFDVIQSVHTLKTLSLIAAAADAAGKKLPIFLQVNISNDASKAGFSPSEVAAAVQSARGFRSLRLEGLMTITELFEAPEGARKDFSALRKLRDEVDAGLALSMGMSADFEIAIEEGANFVRIGTALFGERG